MTTHLVAIGINYSGSQNELRGCINDARAWAVQFGGIAASVTLLLEQQAVKAGIVAAITNVLGKLAAGDTAIITYSGHGTYVPDQSGDEEDHRDEALCPFDLTRNLLLDDELWALLSQRAAGSKVLLITDCCHSGTMTRNVQEDRGQARYVDFASLSTCMCTATLERIHAEARSIRGRSAAEVGGLMTHLAGCQDDQVSYDATIAGKACGAFTYYAIAALKSRKTPGMSFLDWRDSVRPFLPSNRYPQSPGFNGELTAVVPGFEVVAPTAPPTASVVGTLTLGGQVFDVTLRK